MKGRFPQSLSHRTCNLPLSPRLIIETLWCFCVGSGRATVLQHYRLHTYAITSDRYVPLVESGYFQIPHLHTKSSQPTTVQVLLHRGSLLLILLHLYLLRLFQWSCTPLLVCLVLCSISLLCDSLDLGWRHSPHLLPPEAAPLTGAIPSEQPASPITRRLAVFPASFLVERRQGIRSSKSFLV